MADKSICSVSDCDKPARAKGMCGNHRRRFLKYGDPSGGRTPNGVRLRYTHDVVINFSGDECLIWPFTRISTGYGLVNVAGKQLLTSRYVCFLIHGEPPTEKHEAAHSCGRGHEGCVNPKHLRWATSKENKADKLIHGTLLRGEQLKQSKLTEDDIRTIRELKGAVDRNELAARYMITPSHINRIQRRSAWSWLPD